MNPPKYKIVGHCPVCDAPIYGLKSIAATYYSYSSTSTCPKPVIAYSCDCHQLLFFKLQHQKADLGDKSLSSISLAPGNTNS
jgi:hypothetical protein